MGDWFEDPLFIYYVAFSNRNIEEET